MTIETLIWLIATALCASLAALVWIGQRQVRELRANLSLLRDEQVQLAARQSRLDGGAQELNTRISDLVQRHARLDSRPAGGQRIEHAIQIARHGAANEQVLKDLGLSDGEAALLLRLHGLPPAMEPPTPAAARNGAHSAQAQNLAAAMTSQTANA